jgi:hypothetical protein
VNILSIKVAELCVILVGIVLLKEQAYLRTLYQESRPLYKISYFLELDTFPIIVFIKLAIKSATFRLGDSATFLSLKHKSSRILYSNS